MEYVYSFVIDIFFIMQINILFFIKVVNLVWNTAEYITPFIEWDLRNL